MILIHTQNGVIETGGQKFVSGEKNVKVYDEYDRLIGIYLWQNIVGVTHKKDAGGSET